MQPEARILLVDDQPDVIAALKLLLKGERYETRAEDSPAAAVAAIEAEDFAVVLLDLNYSRDTTSGREGLQLIEKIRSLDAELPMVVMTAWSSVPLAVEAMQLGAGDFVEKPWNNQRMLSILRNQIALGRSLRRGRRLEAENALLRGDDGGPFIAGAPSMQSVMALVGRIAPSDANVLITGEHGTGKSLLARIIHAQSTRSAQPLVTVNMGGLADSVFESEMFGHVKGAYTDAARDRVGRFELADKGTLFMDEIANIPPGQQSKLLRVLEDGEFERVGSSRTRRADVRVISATNADLETLVGNDGFREDLLFRLNTVDVQLPPLRQRRDDILPLAEAFLARAKERYTRQNLALSDEAKDALRAHRWPGNIRELDHVVERAVLMAESDSIRSEHLRLAAPSSTGTDFEQLSLEEAERRLIEAALARSGGSVVDAAQALGLSRSALYRRLEKHGIRTGDPDAGDSP